MSVIQFGLQQYTEYCNFSIVHFRDMNPAPNLTKNNEMESNSVSGQPREEIASTSRNYKSRLRRHTDTFDSTSRFDECDNSLTKYPISENDTEHEYDKETIRGTSSPATQSIDVGRNRPQTKEAMSPSSPHMSPRSGTTGSTKDKVCV